MSDSFSYPRSFTFPYPQPLLATGPTPRAPQTSSSVAETAHRIPAAALTGPDVHANAPPSGLFSQYAFDLQVQALAQPQQGDTFVPPPARPFTGFDVHSLGDALSGAAAPHAVQPMAAIIHNTTIAERMKISNRRTVSKPPGHVDLSQTDSASEIHVSTQPGRAILPVIFTAASPRPEARAKRHNQYTPKDQLRKAPEAIMARAKRAEEAILAGRHPAQPRSPLVPSAVSLTDTQRLVASKISSSLGLTLPEAAVAPAKRSASTNAQGVRASKRLRRSSIPAAIDNSSDTLAPFHDERPRTPALGREEVSLANILEYSEPGENLNWLEETNKIKRVQMREIINRRKYAAVQADKLAAALSTQGERVAKMITQASSFGSDGASDDAEQEQHFHSHVLEPLDAKQLSDATLAVVQRFSEAGEDLDWTTVANQTERNRRRRCVHNRRSNMSRHGVIWKPSAERASREQAQSQRDLATTVAPSIAIRQPFESSDYEVEATVPGDRRENAADEAHAAEEEHAAEQRGDVVETGDTVYIQDDVAKQSPVAGARIKKRNGIHPQSIADIAKYTGVGEDLDWTKSSDMIKRRAMQIIIAGRKKADRDAVKVNRQAVNTSLQADTSGEDRDASAENGAVEEFDSGAAYGSRGQSATIVDPDSAPSLSERFDELEDIDFMSESFSDQDYVDSLKQVLRLKSADKSGFYARQCRRILTLLNVATPPASGEALLLSTGDAAAKYLAPSKYFPGPMILQNQQPLALQTQEQYFEEFYNDSVKVWAQDPAARVSQNEPHVREVAMGTVKSRFAKPVEGAPWNLLELAAHREDGLRPAFLNIEDCSLLTKLKLPSSGESASRFGYTEGFKEVEKWTLCAQAGALTEPHQDSHGYSTYITVNQGTVGFGWLSNPTSEERAAWSANHDRYIGGRWRYVLLRPGHTVYFPAGTVHFVFRHPDAGNTLAFGGHVLRCSQIVRWIKVLLKEQTQSTITNEELSVSAPQYLTRVEGFVKQALKNGREEKWGGRDAIEEFLGLKVDFMAQATRHAKSRKQGGRKA
ncbi:hypothetical protein LTR53_003759 [Teratosphaeriaceae sp. CCFEE 6253]|nr:hypothetical protein LTR53_003759 [Teratosphaeriaceae sp. CCFEE 6253]